MFPMQSTQQALLISRERKCTLQHSCKPKRRLCTLFGCVDRIEIYGFCLTAKFHCALLFLVLHSVLLASLSQLVFVHHFPPPLECADRPYAFFPQVSESRDQPDGCQSKGRKAERGRLHQGIVVSRWSLCGNHGSRLRKTGGIRTNGPRGQRGRWSHKLLSQGKHNVDRKEVFEWIVWRVNPISGPFQEISVVCQLPCRLILWWGFHQWYVENRPLEQGVDEKLGFPPLLIEKSSAPKSFSTKSRY